MNVPINHDDFWESINSIPISCLNVLTRERMSWFLTESSIIELSQAGYNKSWKGAGLFIGLQLRDLIHYEREKDPFGLILKQIDDKGIGFLKDVFDKLDRFDILEDSKLIQYVSQDINRFNEESLTNDAMLLRGENTDSSVSLHPAKNKDYHCLIAYSNVDFNFVETAKKVLESEPYLLKLCIPDRDIPGNNFLTDALIAHINKCPKVLCVTSNAFIKSPQCHFILNNTMSYLNNSNKLICVVIEKISDWSYAPLLENWSKLHYLKGPRGQYFWPSCANSIKD